MTDPADESQVETAMSLGEHLDDLRTRLVRAVVGLAVCCGVTLYYGTEILAWILAPLHQILAIFGLPARSVAMGVTTGFSVYFVVSLVAGLIIAFPWIIYQLWCFVRMGLYDSERRIVHILAPFSALMSVLSVLFLYYILLPITLTFMIVFTISIPEIKIDAPGRGGFTERVAHLVVTANNYSIPSRPMPPDIDPKNPAPPQPPLARIPEFFEDPVSPKDGDAWIKQPEGELRVQAGGELLRFHAQRNNSPIEPLLDIEAYLSFVGIMALGTLLAFQLPVVMTIIGWTGLINPDFLAQYRKYCFFACCVVAAVASPPDLMSMTALAIPIYGLFELGLICMRLAYQHTKRRRNDEETSADPGEGEP